ncbi:MAG TPA: spore coat protein U domain-containing protein [Povalibacter sp.]|uniref:Csu type fimbrial protein n=1 Tax=Povalibacter sp. TaxID=1962978 RepID=UPI002BD9AEC8|nr:spore coat protein U domain-containing protein [Povalibacter sp.]HMN43321.1 spore coat protein U domain-containing protein [Povalibacter sp.]
MKRAWLWIVLLWLAAHGAAYAQYCSVSSSGNMNFGTINPPDAAYTSVIGHFNISCGGTTPYIRVCISLGSPTSGTWDPRYMSGPSGARMAYNIYSDYTFSTIWGSEVSPVAEPVAVDIPLQDGGGGWGNGHGTVTYYARVPNQGGLPIGDYQDNMQGVNIVRFAGYTNYAPECSDTMQAAGHVNFTVMAKVASSCVVTATTLDFGTTGNLATTAVNATSTIRLDCPPGVSYNLALDAGRGSGATVAQRRMTHVQDGTKSLTYRLYRDSSHTQLWGDGSAGTTTVNGAPGTFTVHGLLPQQSVPATGEYQDTVTVTVTY